MTQQPARWWQTGIIYQIYPRSFMDSGADGVGDLPGITSKLDYLHWLGADAIWLSPIFPSPMADFGYDVADYTDIHPLFGTLEDFDQLVSEAHARGIKVILDLVPNHTSSQHPWFLESRASRDNAKRDWYIWRDARPDGSPPNNWLAYFGGPSWTWDDDTGQYYLHSFLPEQPDLNWRNPEVRAAMFDAVRFWLKRGVDGFRVDVIDRMIKDQALRDNPPNPEFVEGRDNPTWKYLRLYSENRPGIHELIRELRAVFDEFDDRVMIGEIGYFATPDEMIPFYGSGDEIHLPFNFALFMLPWDAGELRRFVDAYETLMPAHGWPNYVMGNHDRERIATRLGDGQARIAAMLLLTLRGTPFVYQGEEIGMRDVIVPPDQYRDPQGINIGISRDHNRTPMQWDASVNAGFSDNPPWLPIGDDYETLNVASQQENHHSMLTLYRRLIDLRRANSALLTGSYRSYDAPIGCYVYERTAGDQRFVIALNLTSVPQAINLPPLTGRVVLSTQLDRNERAGHTVLDLRPDEGVIIQLGE